MSSSVAGQELHRASSRGSDLELGSRPHTPSLLQESPLHLPCLQYLGHQLEQRGSKDFGDHIDTNVVGR